MSTTTENTTTEQDKGKAAVSEAVQAVMASHFSSGKNTHHKPAGKALYRVKAGQYTFTPEGQEDGSQVIYNISQGEGGQWSARAPKGKLLGEYKSRLAAWAACQDHYSQGEVKAS